MGSGRNRITRQNREAFVNATIVGGLTPEACETLLFVLTIVGAAIHAIFFDDDDSASSGGGSVFTGFGGGGCGGGGGGGGGGC